MSVARRLMTAVLSGSGLASLARRRLARRGSFVIELHGVAARAYPEWPAAIQPSFHRQALETLLDWLASRFDLLDPRRFFAGDRGVMLTFDDGFANLLDNALPALERYCAPAVFFVTTRHVADPGDWLPSVSRAAALCPPLDEAMRRDLCDGLSTEELARVAEHPLITVGSHSVDHPFLTGLGDSELARELEESKRFLEEVTARPVELFAYPTGDYDRRVAAAVRAAGYRAAFAEDSRNLGLGRFEIPRVGLYSAGATYLDVKLSGLHRRPLDAAAWGVDLAAPS